VADLDRQAHDDDLAACALPDVAMPPLQTPSTPVTDAAAEARTPVFPTSVAALIPAWQPEALLPDLVQSLLNHGCMRVIVVDDGSSQDHQPIFERCAMMAGVTVLRHAVNLGKGRALKTGFNFLLTDCPQYTGVVTADADGQHAVPDIVRVAQALAASPRGLVLGARQLDGQVPLRSRFGNTVTRYVFRFLTGRRVFDTQTGLRGIPASRLPELLVLPGERYEYEMTVLAHLCRQAVSPVEVPITTVYLDGNRSSHFDPIRDSMRIYFVLLRFYASSLVAAGIDFVGFSAAYALTHNILLSMIVGRLSSVVNYLLNRGFVFQSGASIRGSVWRYYLLVVVLAGIAFEAIRGLSLYLGWNVLAAKLVIETLLSLASFAVQRTFVFPVPEEDQG